MPEIIPCTLRFYCGFTDGTLKNFFDYGCVTQDLLFRTYGISVYMGINRPQCIRLVVLTKLNLILEHLKSKLFNSSGGRAKK